jgi:hypothetical protein
MNTETKQLGVFRNTERFAPSRSPKLGLAATLVGSYALLDWALLERAERLFRLPRYSTRPDDSALST